MRKYTITKTLATAAAATLIVSGCSQGSSSHDSHGGSESGSSQASAQFNDADVAFAQMMIPHHQSAIEMSRAALPRLRDPLVRAWAQGIIDDQQKEIAELGVRARDGKLTMADMQGGTFTISNGGVYGSLMSSPILNPPQSGILGMHKIQDRPVVVGGEIVIRPMMYLALSYDHRIVDGKGAVTFLVRVKEALEDPRRLLMDL